VQVGTVTVQLKASDVPERDHMGIRIVQGTGPMCCHGSIHADDPKRTREVQYSPIGALLAPWSDAGYILVANGSNMYSVCRRCAVKLALDILDLECL